MMKVSFSTSGTSQVSQLEHLHLFLKTAARPTFLCINACNASIYNEAKLGVLDPSGGYQSGDVTGNLQLRDLEINSFYFATMDGATKNKSLLLDTFLTQEKWIMVKYYRKLTVCVKFIYTACFKTTSVDQSASQLHLQSWNRKKKTVIKVKHRVKL